MDTNLSFGQWFLDFFRPTQKRINRLTFSLRASGIVLIYLLLVAALFKAGTAFLMILYFLASAVLLSLGARRLHDIGFSGWLVLLGFVPVVNIALLGVLLLVPGTNGPNRFGTSTS